MRRLAGGDMVENAHDCMHSERTRMLEFSPQLVCKVRRLAMQPARGSRVTQICQGEWCEEEV